MDDAVLSAEEARELAELRRRAYGPDGDIAHDPGALARLRALEARIERVHDDALEDDTAPIVSGAPAAAADGGTLMRDAPASAPVALAQAPPAEAPGPGPPPALGPVDAAAPAPAAGEGDHPAGRGRSSRAKIALAAAVAGVAGLLIGLFAPVPGSRSPSMHLSATSDAPPPAWQSDLEDWGIDIASVTAYEALDGLGLWVAPSDRGTECLLLSHGLTLWLATCSAAELDPTFDLVVDEDLRSYLEWSYDQGVALRFVARDGRIDVWVSDPPTTEVRD